MSNYALSRTRSTSGGKVEYIFGAGLALLVFVFAALVGLNRDRAFYPTILVVIASYYVLFAAITGSVQVAATEALGGTVFVAVAIAGFKFSQWWIVLGLFAHGIYDFKHGLFIDNAGVPLWWPSFCLIYDFVAAAGLGLLLKLRAGRFANDDDKVNR
jgi:hypothetical protein